MFSGRIAVPGYVIVSLEELFAELF